MIQHKIGLCTFVRRDHLKSHHRESCVERERERRSVCRERGSRHKSHVCIDRGAQSGRVKYLIIFLRIVEFAVTELAVLDIVSLTILIRGTALAKPPTGLSRLVSLRDWVKI